MPAIDKDLFLRLLRIPSVTQDAARVDECVDVLRAYLEAHGVMCSVEQCGDRKALYASTAPGKTQDYLLNAHLDVVPAAPELFEPALGADGILRGRGVADCKGSAAVIAQLLCDFAGRPGIGAIFTTDEEVGGSTTARMAALGYGARRMVLIIDGAPYCIAHAQKGTVSFTLRALGRGGHSSAPWEFDNPIDRLHAAYARIRAVWPAADAPDHWCDTLAATVLRAGEVFNQIPDTAELVLNVRYIAKDGSAAAERLLREAAGEGVEISRGHDSPPVFCDEGHPELRRLAEAMRRAWPDRGIGFEKMMGATDARHFVGLGVPIAILGVDGGALHERGEWLRLASLDEMLAMLEGFLAQGVWIA